MGREVKNVSAEEALRQLEAELEPDTDWPARDDLGFVDRHEEAIAELEALNREDREGTTGL